MAKLVQSKMHKSSTFFKGVQIPLAPPSFFINIQK